jgi:hypothetical protein
MVPGRVPEPSRPVAFLRLECISSCPGRFLDPGDKLLKGGSLLMLGQIDRSLPQAGEVSVRKVLGFVGGQDLQREVFVPWVGSKVVTMAIRGRVGQRRFLSPLLLSAEVYVHARVSPLSPPMVQRGWLKGRPQKASDVVQDGHERQAVRGLEEAVECGKRHRRNRHRKQRHEQPCFGDRPRLDRLRTDRSRPGFPHSGFHFRRKRARICRFCRVFTMALEPGLASGMNVIEANPR